MNVIEREMQIIKVLKFLEKVYINDKTERVVCSIRNFFMENGFLTEKQYNYLMDIYERV